MRVGHAPPPTARVWRLPVSDSVAVGGASGAEAIRSNQP
jgi:hypothetical protein